MNGMNWNGKWIKAKPIFELFLILLFLYSCWETINTTGSFSKQKKKIEINAVKYASKRIVIDLTCFLKL